MFTQQKIFAYRPLRDTHNVNIDVKFHRKFHSSFPSEVAKFYVQFNVQGRKNCRSPSWVFWAVQSVIHMYTRCIIVMGFTLPCHEHMDNVPQWFALPLTATKQLRTTFDLKFRNRGKVYSEMLHEIMISSIQVFLYFPPQGHNRHLNMANH